MPTKKNCKKTCDVEVNDQNSVRRSSRSRKATDFYIPEVSVNSTKKDKTKTKSNKLEAKKSSSVECEDKQNRNSESQTKTNKSREKSTTKQRKGRKAIGKLLYDYRNNRPKTRIPDYQKRLKYVERDPSIDILNKKLGLISQRLSAISEGEEGF